MDDKTTKMKRGDFIMLLFAGAIGGGLLLWTSSSDWMRKLARTPEDPLIATVQRNGKVAEEVDINSVKDSKIINFDDGLKVTIEVKHGQIRFLSSECTDQICVNTGWLSQEGHLAACLPARTVISL